MWAGNSIRIHLKCMHGSFKILQCVKIAITKTDFESVMTKILNSNPILMEKNSWLTMCNDY